MSVQQRPSDEITEDFLLLGLPVVEYAFQLASGAFDPYFQLGIIDSAEFQKALQFAQLRSAQSGTSKLKRELVRQFDGTLQVGTFRHNGQNLQLMFGSSSLTSVSGGVAVVTDDPFRLTSDDQDFLDLANRDLVEPITDVRAAAIVAEAVGTGDGLAGSGAVSGDFALDYKPLLVADVSSVTVAGVAFTPIAVGAAAAGNEVEVVVGASATSGDLQFFVGAVATNVTGAILASYDPSHAIVENTDFAVDYKAGRVRIFSHDQAGDPFKDGQPMEADYSHNAVDHDEIAPFTQFVFPGKARIRQLTDVGSNLIWTVPKAQARLTDDAFVFSRDEFTVTSIAMQLLEDDTAPSAPFGTLEVYEEGTF